MRILPLPDEATEFYWQAASRRELAVQRCRACRTFVHPPRSECVKCASKDFAPERVSGRGTVYSFTISHHAAGGVKTPFALVLVELVEQPGLRILANLLDCPHEQVRCGMPVEVAFEEVEGGVTLPQFRPASRPS